MVAQLLSSSQRWSYLCGYWLLVFIDQTIWVDGLESVISPAGFEVFGVVRSLISCRKIMGAARWWRDTKSADVSNKTVIDFWRWGYESLFV
jgi:hypothetical protein